MMSQRVVTAIFIALFLALILLAINIKQAYKVLPGSTSKNLETAPFADWRKYGSKFADFTVSLPAIPQYVNQSVAIPGSDKKRKYQMYASEKINSTTFMISLITYPDEVSPNDQEHLLTDIVEEMKQANPNNQLVKMEPTTYQNYRGFNFNIRNPQYDVLGKTFMKDKTVYLLTYISKDDNFDQAEASHFFDSFQLNSAK